MLTSTTMLTLAWAITGLIVIALELLTGTFYLLVIGLALLVGALLTWGGLAFTPTVVITVVLGAGGCAWLRLSGFGRGLSKDTAPPLDVDLPVTIDTWNEDGSARAFYRGSHWDADLTPGARRDAPLVVAALRGNRLLLKNA